MASKLSLTILKIKKIVCDTIVVKPPRPQELPVPWRTNFRSSFHSITL